MILLSQDNLNNWKHRIITKGSYVMQVPWFIIIYIYMYIYGKNSIYNVIYIIMYILQISMAGTHAIRS